MLEKGDSKNIDFKKYLSEFIGVFAIVFFGCGAVVVDGLKDGIIGHIAINVSFGVIVMVMIYVFGNVSGAHFNPAVTIAFWAAKKFQGKMVLPYIISQILGGIGGAYMLVILYPMSPTYGENMPSGTTFQALILEIVMTFFLMLIIHGVSTKHLEKGIMAGIAIGSYIAIEGFIAGPVSSSSMNPARSIGPALASGDYTKLWIFLIGPVIGALLASMVRTFTTNEVVAKVKS